MWVNVFANSRGRATFPFPRAVGVAVLTALLALAVLPFAVTPVDAARYRYSPPKAAMVIDGHTGRVLYEHNADAPRYPASLTKVMTLYILFEFLRDRRLDMDTKLTVSAYAAARPPSKLGLKPGSSIKVRDAIRALVTKSANDVAAVIAENLGGSEKEFAALMTRKARELGMKNTTFRNASGLPNSAQKTTARDLIRLGQRMLSDFPTLSQEFRRRYFKYRGRAYRNHNRLLFSYRGTQGIKTGYVRASGFNVLTSVRRGKKHLIGVVMGGRSARERDAWMRRLLDKSWAKAITLDELKRRQRLRVAELPARNPAFRPSSREMTIRKQMIAASEQPQSPFAEQLKRKLAFAGLHSGGVLAQLTPVEHGGDADDVSDGKGGGGDVRSRAAIVMAGDTPETSAVPEKRERRETLAGPYHLQVGAYETEEDAQRRLRMVSGKAGSILQGHPASAVHVELSGRDIYRARFGGFNKTAARSACTKLRRRRIDCMAVAAN